MLQYMFSDVVLHIFCIIATFIQMFALYSFFPYVCEVSLEVFFVPGTVGKQGVLGTGLGARWEQRTGAW
jgi:hypothetical protein